MAKRLILVAAFALLLAVILAAKPEQLFSVIAAGDGVLLVAAFAAANAAVALRIAKWRALLAAPLAKLAPVQMAGVAIGNFTPGKAAEPLKALLLRAKTGIAISHSLPSIVWERVLDVFVVLVFSLLAFFLIGGEFFLLAAAGMAIMAAAAAAAAFVLVDKKRGASAMRFFMRFPIVRRLPADFPDLFYRTHVLRSRIAASLLLTAGAWLLEGLVLKLALLAIGIDIALAAATGIAALSVVIGIASMLPGGIGSSELVIVLLLGASGVPAPAAAAGALLARSLSFWYNNALGAVSLAAMRIDVSAALRSAK